jgi:hypothetical protein
MRKQRVCVLSVKSATIREDIVENVHYDKNLAAVEVTYAGMQKYCERRDMLDEFLETSRPEDYPVTLDFESVFTGLENASTYQALLDVVRRGDLASLEEKVVIASFVNLQMLRGHGVMQACLEMNRRHGCEDFEYFVDLKRNLGDQAFQFELLKPMILSDWTLYQTSDDTFPLCDTAVCVRPGHKFVPLSPRLPLRDLDRLSAYQRTEIVDSGVTFCTVACYRNVDLCETDAKPTQNGEKPAQNGANRGQNRVDSKTRYIYWGAVERRISLRFEEASTTRPLKGNCSARRPLPPPSLAAAAPQFKSPFPIEGETTHWHIAEDPRLGCNRVDDPSWPRSGSTFPRRGPCFRVANRPHMFRHKSTRFCPRSALFCAGFSPFCVGFAQVDIRVTSNSTKGYSRIGDFGPLIRRKPGT